MLKHNDWDPHLRLSDRVGNGRTRQNILLELAVVLFGLNATAATPVAWWNFEDADNPRLDSVGGNNAILIGKPPPTVTGGHSGWGAINLNGNGQYLAVPDAPALDITGPLTVMVWAKANAVGANYSFVYKASRWDDGQMAYGLDLRFPEGFYPRFWVSSDGHATGFKEVVSPVALQPGGWHLIAGVYDRRNLNIYVDGRLRASTPYRRKIKAGKAPLYIGWDWNTTWNGALDDVRLFNVALSPEQIYALYKLESLSVDVHLVGSFGRVPVGQTKTNKAVFTNLGTKDLAITATLSGPDADKFQLLTPAGNFILHPGTNNAVTVPLYFQPDGTRVFLGSLSVTSSVNTVRIPLAGQGVTNAWRPLSLDLQTRNPTSGRILHAKQTINSSQMAILVVDMWDSHPDPGEASAMAGLIPMMNQTLDAARAQGIPVIFCPNEVPLPDEADHSIFGNLRDVPQRDNGFSPPLPPYIGAVAGDMVPIPYHAAYAPTFSYPTSQHPHLVVKPGDLVSISRQEIWNYCSANGIHYLLYMGVAANMCVSFTREMSMIPMKRYCGLQPIMVRNLTDSMSLNGRLKGGDDDRESNIDGTMTPSRGHRKVTASIEAYICPTIDARQLTQHWDPAKYANLITGQSNLMSYWRMDSQASYQQIVDMQQLQSCWWNRSDSNQMAGLIFGIPGVVAGDPDTTVKFNGASTLLVSPIYRVHIPTNSPLTSLSASNFSIELWVRIDQLNNSNQWFYAHDDGTSAGVDVLLGINASNHFEFVVGRNASGDGFGDVVASSNVVTQADVDSHRWFHLVAEHDMTRRTIGLYVDGAGRVTAPHNCTPMGLDAAPHLGSRGLVEMGTDGYLSSLGFEGFCGALDEVAVYSSALDAAIIGTHYNVARENSTSEVGPCVGYVRVPFPAPRLTAYLTKDNRVIVSWPSSGDGFVLEQNLPAVGTNWTSVAKMPIDDGLTKSVLINSGGGTVLFRLKRTNR
ncbi:MAG TPA: LamG-like jellyroll fold domain-containing protein [Candidatus Limnocylindrales bacterium]|nr:LamG-like jellyroll fold domain-containing protein [Candidatus Limnocylindrales bacterium]